MVAIVGAALLMSLGPAEVNGDGIGYLKAAREGVHYPGHLGYVPLLAGVLRVWRWLGLGEATLGGGVLPGRLLSASSAGLAAAVLGAFIAKRTGASLRGMVGAAGLLCSAGLLVAGSDIECYAPATLALVLIVALLDEPTCFRGALAGLGLAAAVLLHIENVLFAAPALLLCNRRGSRIALIAACAPVLAVAYLPVLGTLPHATHGFAYPLHVYTPIVAVWGALRALVYVPYPYEASLGAVAGATSVALALALALAVMATRGGARVPLRRAVIIAWVVPYTLVGAAFFASDSERWIFLSPLVWIALAALVPPRGLAALVAVVLAANLALWLPRARDRRRIDHAQAVGAHLQRATLVIGPGHGWDESLPLVADVTLFPIVFHTARTGGEAGMLRALDEALDAARARGTPIVRVRVDETDDPSGTLGYKELAAFHIDRARLRALLDARGVRAIGP